MASLTARPRPIRKRQRGISMIASMLTWTASVNAAIPQHRVRKSNRPVPYRHVTEDADRDIVPKFWIPFSRSRESHDQIDTESARSLYVNDIPNYHVRASSRESYHAGHNHHHTPEILYEEEESLWYLHADASLASPDDVYRERKERRDLHANQEQRKWSIFDANIVHDPYRRRTQVDTKKFVSTNAVQGEYEVGTDYTTGDVDSEWIKVQSDGGEVENTTSLWNVTTEVEYSTAYPVGDEVLGNATTNDTSVYSKVDKDYVNATTLYQPIRIRAILLAEGGGGEFLNETERQILFNDVLSPSILAWSAALRVDPVIGNLTVDREQLYDRESCGPGLDSGHPSVPVPPLHFTLGIPDTDIVLYLSLGFVYQLNVTEGIQDTGGVNESDLTQTSEHTQVFLGTSEPSAESETPSPTPLDQSIYNYSSLSPEDFNQTEPRPLCTGDYLASASYCSTDQYDRPTAAMLHLCIDPDFFLTSSLDRVILTVIHEIGHALGFNTQSMAHFRNADGTPITPRVHGDIVDTEVECTGPIANRRTASLPLPSDEILQFREVRGVRVAEVVTPSVQQVVRNHFDCPSLAGGELESGMAPNTTNATSTDDEGAYSCIGDHWEERIFRLDIMNPIVDEVPFSLRISPLTLALFADSGWYQVDLSRAGFPSGWGRGVGCSFVNDTCVDENGMVPEANKPFFCNDVVSSLTRSTIDEIHGCSPDLSRKATCALAQYDQNLPVEYQYFNSTFGPNIGGNEPFLDYCPVFTGFANGLCKEKSNRSFLQVSSIEQFGEKNSRCVTGIIGGKTTGLCVPIACVIEDRTLRIKVDGTWRLCTFSGQELKGDNDDAAIVVCPDPIRTCPTFYCSSDCLGTGGVCDYSTGECLCTLNTTNVTLVGTCGDLHSDKPPYDHVFYEAEAKSPLADPLLSEYYVGTEASLQNDRNKLELWFIVVLVVVGGSIGLVLTMVTSHVLKGGEDRLFRGWLSWWRPTGWNDFPEDTESPNPNKDKFVATMLVDIRIHDPHLRSTGSETVVDTEGSMTDTDCSGHFTVGSMHPSIADLDDFGSMQDTELETSNQEAIAQFNDKSDVPHSTIRKRIVPEGI